MNTVGIADVVKKEEPATNTQDDEEERYRKEGYGKDLIATRFINIAKYVEDIQSDNPNNPDASWVDTLLTNYDVSKVNNDRLKFYLEFMKTVKKDPRIMKKILNVYNDMKERKKKERGIMKKILSLMRKYVSAKDQDENNYKTVLTDLIDKNQNAFKYYTQGGYIKNYINLPSEYKAEERLKKDIDEALGKPNEIEEEEDATIDKEIEKLQTDKNKWIEKIGNNSGATSLTTEEKKQCIDFENKIASQYGLFNLKYDEEYYKYNSNIAGKTDKYVLDTLVDNKDITDSISDYYNQNYKRKEKEDKAVIEKQLKENEISTLTDEIEQITKTIEPLKETNKTLEEKLKNLTKVDAEIIKLNHLISNVYTDAEKIKETNENLAEKKYQKSILDQDIETLNEKIKQDVENINRTFSLGSNTLNDLIINLSEKEKKLIALKEELKNKEKQITEENEKTKKLEKLLETAIDKRKKYLDIKEQFNSIKKDLNKGKKTNLIYAKLESAIAKEEYEYKKKVLSTLEKSHLTKDDETDKAILILELLNPHLEKNSNIYNEYLSGLKKLDEARISKQKSKAHKEEDLRGQLLYKYGLDNLKNLKQNISKSDKTELYTDNSPIQKFIDDYYDASYETDNKTKQSKLKKAIFELEDSPQDVLKTLKISREDRMVFIITTFVIRYITMNLVQWCIDINFVKDFYQGFLLYAAIYCAFFWLIVMFVNVNSLPTATYMHLESNISGIRSIFYYFYMETNGISRLLTHTAIIIIMLLIPVVVNINYKTKDAEEKPEFLPYEDKKKLIKILSLLTIFLWIFTSIIAIKF